MTLSNATSRTILSKKVEFSFDIVAVFGNNVERVFQETFRLSRKDEILRKNSWDVVAKNDNNVEATFDFAKESFDL